MAKSVYPLPGDQMEERLRRSEMEERDQRGRVEDKEGAHFKRFLKGRTPMHGYGRLMLF